MPPQFRLPFEKEIYEMEDLLAKLEADLDGRPDGGEEVRRMRRRSRLVQSFWKQAKLSL